MILASIILPLISALSGATANVISKEIIDDTGYIELTTLTFLTIFLLMAPFSILFFQITKLQAALPLIAFIVVADSAANLLYFKGLERIQVSKANAFLSLSPLFTALITPFILPEQFGPGVFIAAVGITLSVYFVQTGYGVKEFIKNLRNEHTYLIIASASIFAATAIPVRILIRDMAAVNSPTLYWIRSIAIFATIMLVMRPDLRTVSNRNIGIISFKSIFVIISWVLLFYSISHFNLIFSYSLAKTVPFFTLLIAWNRLDEKITLQKVVGIAVLIISIAVAKAV